MTGNKITHPFPVYPNTKLIMFSDEEKYFFSTNHKRFVKTEVYIALLHKCTVARYEFVSSGDIMISLFHITIINVPILNGRSKNDEQILIASS